MKQIEKTNPSERKLNAELVLNLWSRTYNTEGKPDWSHIFPYYHDDIVFQDTIQTIRGKADFMAMCNRLTKRCDALRMDILSIAENHHEIFMEWKMTMVFRKTPSTPIFGCTKLAFGPDGRIIQQRDYYDLWGDIFNNVPIMKKLYPRLLRKIFG